MTAAVAPEPGRSAGTTDIFLVVGIVVAALTEAIASTVLSLGRNDIIGETHATPDEFAWLDIGYTTFKFIGFMIAPWLISRFSSRNLLVAAVAVIGAACAAATATDRLDVLITLRIAQGISGGVLLISAQTALFVNYKRRYQPILQALFACGSVVAPATIVPAFQGWLLDTRSWDWIFFSVFPLALAAITFLHLADKAKAIKAELRPFDWIGFILIAAALFCFTYVFSQGSRWDWFEEARIVSLTFFGSGALLAFLGRQIVAGRNGLLDFTVFRITDFSFAFAVSFVAGAALFGSAFLIPAFALSVLSFTPTDAGQLLLPSGALFVVSLFLAASLFQTRRFPPISTVPVGIVLVMLAMWLLSGSTVESGPDDMMPAILIRGAGLGCLFLSITLIAFSKLDDGRLASGTALFSTGRQFGGLIGVAALQTLLDHHVAANVATLGANVTLGAVTVGERLSRIAGLLAAQGFDGPAANRAAVGLLYKAVAGQSAVIAFDTAFNAVALLFVIAAPVLVAIKFGISRLASQADY